MTAARIPLACAAAACAFWAALTLAGEGRLAPIPDATSVSRHAPYEMGQCDICHDPDDKEHVPGRLLKPGDALCYDCHDEFRKSVKGHPAFQGAKSGCVTCHSPHNSKRPKLLL